MAAFDLHEVLDALPAETSPPTEPILAIEPTSGFIPLAQLRVGEVQRIRAYVVKVYKHGMIMLGDRSSRLYARKPATIQVQLGQCVEAQVQTKVLGDDRRSLPWKRHNVCVCGFVARCFLSLRRGEKLSP